MSSLRRTAPRLLPMWCNGRAKARHTRPDIRSAPARMHRDGRRNLFGDWRWWINTSSQPDGLIYFRCCIGTTIHQLHFATWSGTAASSRGPRALGDDEKLFCGFLPAFER